MTNSVLAATFSDFRLVRGRKVAQLVMEVPIEQAEVAISLFGMPRPDKERWVAIAPLPENYADIPEASPPAEQAAPPRTRNVPERAPLEGWERDRWDAVRLCRDAAYQAWAHCANEEQAVENMRARIGGSRSLIATDADVRRRFLDLKATYEFETPGLMAARR